MQNVNSLSDAEKLSFIAMALDLEGAVVNGNWVTPEGAVFNWLKSNADSFECSAKLKLSVVHNMTVGGTKAVASGWGEPDFSCTAVVSSGDDCADQRLAISTAAVYIGINRKSGC